MYIRNLVLSLCILGFTLSSAGCSVYMAANQPEKRDTKVFAVGTPRNVVISEVGMPVATKTQEDGCKVELYRWRQGYSGGAKAVRAVGHGVMDVLTIGLWEVVGTPAEAVMDGEMATYEVTYDEDECIKQVVELNK